MDNETSDTTIPQWYGDFMALPVELPELDGVTAADDGTLHLTFSDERWLSVEAADRSGVLVLSMSLGPVPEGREKTFYEAALSVNLLWRDTAGLWLGLGGAGGDMVLLQRIASEGVSALVGSISDFRAFAERWRALMDSADSTDPSVHGGPARVGLLA